MEQFNLLLDLDSTTTNLVDPWFELNNKMFDDDLTIEKVTAWNTALFSKGGTKVFDLLKTPGLFRNLEPMPHAIEVITRLYNQYPIYIGSAISSEQEQYEKREWLAEYLPFIPADHIAFTTEKTKNNLFPGQEMHLLFDDGPHNLESWRAIKVAMRYPYNTHVQVDRFVSDWLEFERILPELQQRIA